MNTYQLRALEEALPGLLLAVAASAGQWFVSPRNLLSVFASSHGLLFAAAFGYALAVSPYSEPFSRAGPYVLPYEILCGLGAISAASASILRVGPILGRVPFSLAGLAGGAWVWFIGGMTIAHDWL